MPVVTSDILAETLAGLNIQFNSAYLESNEKAAWPMVATEIPTTLPLLEYGWLGRGAVMEQLNDRPLEQELLQHTQALSDITYKGRMKIDRRTIEDDQYGLLMMRVRDLGAEPTRHWNQLVFQGLQNGFSNLCYDGQDFFSASHSEGSSGTQSNTTTNSLTDANLQTAESAMMGILDDKGIPMEIVPDTLVVGPLLSRVAADLLGSEIVVKQAGAGAIGSGATAYTPYNNYYKGRYRLVVNHYINTYNWFLLDTSKSVKPLVMQSRSDVPITIETDMLEPSALMNEQFRFDVRGRYAQGYGLWQCAYGSSASS